MKIVCYSPSHCMCQPYFFFKELKSKAGFWLGVSVYVTVDYICKGYLELIGTRVERELQNENFMPTVGFQPGTFRLRSEGVTTELQRLVYGSSPGFTCAIFKKFTCITCYTYTMYKHIANQGFWLFQCESP